MPIDHVWSCLKRVPRPQWLVWNEPCHEGYSSYSTFETERRIGMTLMIVGFNGKRFTHRNWDILFYAQRRDCNPHSTLHLRKEFVDMPLGVSEADGRPGAGVHFEGFTYQGEWPLAFSLVFPGTFDPGYMTSKRFEFFCDQWLSYINSILQVVWAVLQSFIDPR